MRLFALAAGLVLLAAPASAQAERIVSLGGSVTEILYALGAEDRIVAVDSTSLYPPRALAEKENVGYLRQLSAEGVLSVEPDLIIAEPDVGPEETVGVLEQANVAFSIVPEARDGEGLAAKIRAVGASVGAGAAADALAARCEDALARIEDIVAGIDEKPAAIFILSLQGGRILAAGTDTAADAMIRLAGGRNVLADFSGYKPVTAEALAEAAPEVIVMMDRGEGHVASLDEIRAIPALAATPAATNGRLVTMDGLLLLGFGPRTAEAVHDLAAAFHPSLDLPEVDAPSPDPT